MICRQEACVPPPPKADGFDLLTYASNSVDGSGDPVEEEEKEEEIVRINTHTNT